MDIEIKVKCSRCLTEYYMGTQTHNYKWKDERPMVGGMCPHCNNYNVVLMHPEQIELYPKWIPKDVPPDCPQVTVVPYHAG